MDGSSSFRAVAAAFAPPHDLEPLPFPRLVSDMAERRLDSRTVTKSAALASALSTYGEHGVHK